MYIYVCMYAYVYINHVGSVDCHIWGRSSSKSLDTSVWQTLLSRLSTSTFKILVDVDSLIHPCWPTAGLIGGLEHLLFFHIIIGNNHPI